MPSDDFTERLGLLLDRLDRALERLLPPPPSPRLLRLVGDVNEEDDDA